MWDCFQQKYSKLKNCLQLLYAPESISNHLDEVFRFPHEEFGIICSEVDFSRLPFCIIILPLLYSTPLTADASDERVKQQDKVKCWHNVVSSRVFCYGVVVPNSLLSALHLPHRLIFRRFFSTKTLKCPHFFLHLLFFVSKNMGFYLHTPRVTHVFITVVRYQHSSLGTDVIDYE